MRERDVLADIRVVRDELAVRYGEDARALATAMAERSRAAGRAVVRFPPRPPLPPRAARTPSAVAESPAPNRDEVTEPGGVLSS